eukprot:GSChrysophyteH1.ASY1.ANO1.2024.1 assembled CDS
MDDISSANPIQWYPGHIAKAEREINEYLKKVDVVIELRDARIPLSSAHPSVSEWVVGKPRIVAISRMDQITDKARQLWGKYYTEQSSLNNKESVNKVYFIDGKNGKGVKALKQEALVAAEKINEKRRRRGIQPRPVRVAVIGFPNVGKSALINRLLGKRIARSANRAGVTRTVQWVRLGGGSHGGSASSIELLDTPGIIPARHIDQFGALKLAICNDIGEASYDKASVAAKLCDQISRRYGKDIPFEELTGEETLEAIAEKLYRGNLPNAAGRLLGDFRKGHMGRTSLEVPPLVVEELEDMEAFHVNRKGRPRESLVHKTPRFEGW